MGPSGVNIGRMFNHSELSLQSRMAYLLTQDFTPTTDIFKIYLNS